MDNSKKIVKRSGILGELAASGEIGTIEALFPKKESFYDDVLTRNREVMEDKKQVSVVVSNENEIIKIDPSQCEPWEYANRSIDEMGDMNELMQSIQERGQLQPVMLRFHPKPTGVIRYQIIFGRRRYEACLKLGIPLLAIKKDLVDIQKAILDQDAENRHRKNVSNYSNAVLYKKLIQDGIFKSESELAVKLEMARQTLNDIMAFSKLPEDIIKSIPNIHEMSTSLAVKIVSLIKKDDSNHAKILAISPYIGKTITSAEKVEKIILTNPVEKTKVVSTKVVEGKDGKKLFTLIPNNNGGAKIILHDEFGKEIDYDHFYNYLKNYAVARIHAPV